MFPDEILPPLSLQDGFVPSTALRGCFATGVVAARVESLQGRTGVSMRQVEGLFESMLSESFA